MFSILSPPFCVSGIMWSFVHTYLYRLSGLAGISVQIRSHIGHLFSINFILKAKSENRFLDVLALGEETDFETLNCLLVLNLTRSTKLDLIPHMRETATFE